MTEVNGAAIVILVGLVILVGGLVTDARLRHRWGSAVVVIASLMMLCGGLWWEWTG